MLARAYVEAGMLGEAVAEFEKQLSIYTSPRSYCGTMDVLMRYYLGVAYEESRWNKKAIEQYEAFLDYWRDADPQIWEIEDAENRLTRLKNLP
jgi:tetratricopeptide (TPR) repeat protein